MPIPRRIAVTLRATGISCGYRTSFSIVGTALVCDIPQLGQFPHQIARLKGLKGRPSIKPSGMENATGLKRGGKRAKRRRRGKVTARVVPETEVLRVAHPTDGVIGVSLR